MQKPHYTLFENAIEEAAARLRKEVSAIIDGRMRQKELPSQGCFALCGIELMAFLSLFPTDTYVIITDLSERNSVITSSHIDYVLETREERHGRWCVVSAVINDKDRMYVSVYPLNQNKGDE